MPPYAPDGTLAAHPGVEQLAVLAQGFKVDRRGKFLSRHMDLVWEDVRKEVPVHNDKAGG